MKRLHLRAYELVRRWAYFWIEFLTLPSLFMDNKRHAEWHINHVCPHCPKFRQDTRDVTHKGCCWWNAHWKKGDYSLPRNYGWKNFILYYLGAKKLRLRFFQEIATHHRNK